MVHRPSLAWPYGPQAILDRYALMPALTDWHLTAPRYARKRGIPHPDVSGLSPHRMAEKMNASLGSSPICGLIAYRRNNPSRAIPAFSMTRIEAVFSVSVVAEILQMVGSDRATRIIWSSASVANPRPWNVGENTYPTEAICPSVLSSSIPTGVLCWSSFRHCSKIEDASSTFGGRNSSLWDLRLSSNMKLQLGVDLIDLECGQMGTIVIKGSQIFNSSADSAAVINSARFAAAWSLARRMVGKPPKPIGAATTAIVRDHRLQKPKSLGPMVSDYRSLGGLLPRPVSGKPADASGKRSGARPQQQRGGAEAVVAIRSLLTSGTRHAGATNGLVFIGLGSLRGHDIGPSHTAALRHDIAFDGRRKFAASGPAPELAPKGGAAYARSTSRRTAAC